MRVAESGKLEGRELAVARGREEREVKERIGVKGFAMNDGGSRLPNGM